MSHLRFCRATKSQRVTMKSHAATLRLCRTSESRDKIAGVTWHFVAIKHPRIFNVHLHTDVEELRVQASDYARRFAPITNARLQCVGLVLVWHALNIASPNNAYRPTSVPSGILIHETVWPQYTCYRRQTEDIS